MSYDEFADQESGGGITDYTITVTNAYFELDAKYSAKAGADTYKLNWEGTTDVEGHEVMDRDGFHPAWVLDPDWLSVDGGKTVKSQSGKSKLGKAAGRMMGAAANAVLEAGYKDSPESPFSKPGASPRNAETWIGTTWYVTEVTKDFGNDMVARDALPVKFIVLGAAPAVAAAPVATPAAAPVADARVGVEALAASMPDHAAFVTAAMAMPGVASDAALVGEIVAAGPEGLWAKAQA